MRRPRYVLFSSRPALPSRAAIAKALAAIPHVDVIDAPPEFVVHDRGARQEIRVTLAHGALIAADLRALEGDHWRDDAEGRALLATADARFELRYLDGDAAINPMLLVQDALERLTGGFGYDLDFNRISIAREGESIVTDVGPEQRAEDERLMSEIEAMSGEELDRHLREGGLDPQKVRREGAEFGAQMMLQRDLYDALRAAVERAGSVAREPRARLLATLAALRKVPAVGGAVGWLLRDRGQATMRDGELQAVVDEIGKWEKSGRLGGERE
jgi:hypothetical protein